MCFMLLGMDASCRRLVLDLHEDPVQFPVQCEDTEESEVAPAEDNGRLADDFIDLREDVFPVQCTEPSLPNQLLHRATLSVFLDVLP